MKKIVEVAAAVILRGDGAFLLGRRPPGSIYAGYWEFPGGKVEAGETPHGALLRELNEELGIVVESAFPWIVREFVYEHAHVRLHFFRVLKWSGELRDLQHDALEWQFSGDVRVAPLLPANAPVLAALTLPEYYAILNAPSVSKEGQLAALTRALDRGSRLIQLCKTEIPSGSRSDFVHKAVELCHCAHARVLVGSDEGIANSSDADGIHLTMPQLMTLKSRPDFPLVTASCLNGPALAQAAQLGLDFVVFGPINEATNNLGQLDLRFEGTARIIADYPIPVYVHGESNRDELHAAWRAGTHGIAHTVDA